MAEMVFKVPSAAGQQDGNRFEFELDGTTYSVPKLDYLTGEQMMLFAEAEDALLGQKFTPRHLEIIFKVFEMVTDAPVRTLEVTEQLLPLFQAWSGAGEVEPGESDGSPDSSASTAPKSSTRSSSKAKGSATPALTG